MRKSELERMMARARELSDDADPSIELLSTLVIHLTKAQACSTWRAPLGIASEKPPDQVMKRGSPRKRASARRRAGGIGAGATPKSSLGA